MIKGSRGHRDRCIKDTPVQCPGMAQHGDQCLAGGSGTQDSCGALDVSVLCVSSAAFVTQVMSWAVQGAHCTLQPCGTKPV